MVLDTKVGLGAVAGLAAVQMATRAVMAMMGYILGF
jgi:hypothetical protein